MAAILNSVNSAAKKGSEGLNSLAKQGTNGVSSALISSKQLASEYGIKTATPTGMDAWTRFSAVNYTESPIKLFFADMGLLFQEIWSLPFVILPAGPTASGAYGELYPSFRNLWAGFVHGVLSVAQIIFLGWVGIAGFIGVPFNIIFIVVVTFFFSNWLICEITMNRGAQEMETDLIFNEPHDDERWIFLNGVACGKHWFKQNLERLAYTFKRNFVGLHNPTSGALFDVLQCLIQRDFAYATEDIRAAHGILKRALGSKGESYKKVVLIIHSQGGIEGSLILDWLLAELPQEQLSKLEIYSFGNAANHFNNPNRAVPEAIQSKNSELAGKTAIVEERAIKYIEHYANRYDAVARIGVLYYAGSRTEKQRNNRFAGTVFEHDSKGHMLNHHYLDQMFPLHPDMQLGCRDDNVFMDTIVFEQVGAENRDRVNPPKHARTQDDRVIVRNISGADKHQHDGGVGASHQHTVGELSRLWKYRNGGSPEED